MSFLHLPGEKYLGFQSAPCPCTCQTRFTFSLGARASRGRLCVGRVLICATEANEGLTGFIERKDHHPLVERKISMFHSHSFFWLNVYSVPWCSRFKAPEAFLVNMAVQSTKINIYKILGFVYWLKCLLRSNTDRQFDIRGKL